MISELSTTDVGARFTGEPPLAWILPECFWASYLLTGCAGLAEKAVEEAISIWNPAEDSHNQLLFKTVRAALRLWPSFLPSKGRTPAIEIPIPSELCTVMKLSPPIRSCFVLRVLIKLPVWSCAQLLKVSVSEVEQNSCAAMKAFGDCYE